LKKPLFNLPITSIFRQKAEALFHKKTPQKDNHDKESVALNPKNEIEILRTELEFLYKELDCHNKEKDKRADELILANTELKYQQGEKQNRADELVIANTELIFQQGEKQDRADELVIVNNQHNHQQNENDRITDALIILNANQTSKKERLSFIIQGSNVGTWEWNITTGETIFNERLANIIGYTLAEISPTNFSTFEKFTHPDDVLQSRELLHKHFRKEILYYKCELRMKHRNGHWVWLLETGAVHKWDEVGKPILMSGTHQDITERKLAEEKIKESEERFRLMADTAPVLIWMSGADSMCNYFNKSWINFTGRTLAEEIGEGWMKYLHPNDFTNCIEIYNNAIKVQQEFKMEFRLMCANGEYGWLLNHAVPRFENDGTFLGYIGSCVDITISKKLQITLEKYTKDLEVSNTELENFAFVASHDLKEPLRMVNSYLRLLEIKLGNQLDEKTSKYIHYASDGANRMKILIDNLLQYSSVSSNKDPFIQLDLNEELNYIQLILKDTIENNNAGLYIHPMPKIIANKTLINELFVNILNNALKYRDEKDPIIEVGYKDDLDSYVFYIKDNGIGIKEEDFSKIFILFSRLHNKNTYSGTGIGLAQCKKIVEIHKGKIWLESEVGVGSTFYFSIPKLEKFITAN
jgi:PAS domain S-box-containing protein